MHPGAPVLDILARRSAAVSRGCGISFWAPLFHHRLGSSVAGTQSSDQETAQRCRRMKNCIPTSQDYTNINGGGVPSPGMNQWPVCNGSFALCSFANCSILTGTNPPQAACGCFEPGIDTFRPNMTSLVTANIIKSLQVYNATSDRCFGGQVQTANNTCTFVNSAPFCKAMNKNTIVSLGHA